MVMGDDDIAIPVMRSDIQLNEAPPEPEGAPTWTLYDPAANKYYKIGWLEFECLSRFRGSKTGTDLIARVAAETSLRPDIDTIKALVAFLLHHNLVLASGEGAATHFETQRAKREKAWWERILHGYLFFTLPLFKPQAFLERTFPLVRFLFTRQFMTVVVALLAYGVFLSFQRFDEITHTFMSYLNFEGVVLFLAATVVVKIIHEMGHAWAATKYGVPVNVMGVAFIVMYPVLYTETSNAWKLKNRRDRVYIAAAGVMAELALASVALLLWHVLTPGVWQSLCFMVAIVSMGASLVVNLNPLMRFDGYYLFSDLVGYDNLQDRSFGFVKWKLRRFLWGWDDPPPEYLPVERQHFLTVFGSLTVIYRLFLYIGIAIVVYHVFFQPLGLILMLVELAFFIALPILREVKVWIARASDINLLSGGGVILGILVLAALAAFLPVQRSIEIPAVLHAGSYTRLYTPVAARLDEIAVREGQAVKAGDVLFRLSSMQLDYNIQVTSQRLESIIQIRDSSQATRDLARQHLTLDSEIESARKELEGYQAIREQLIVRAPYDGVVREVDRTLHPGQWVSSKVSLGLLVGAGAPVLSGYVREQDMARITQGAKGRFYAEFSINKQYDVVLRQIDQATATEIYWPELSSVYSGPLPAERDRGGAVRPLPRYNFYAAKLDLAGVPGSQALPPFVARGTVRLEATPTNLSKVLIKRAISVIIREGGF